VTINPFCNAMKRLLGKCAFIICLLWSGLFLRADGLNPAFQAKLNEQLAVIANWAADPVVIEAVKAHNAALPAGQAALTQDKWQSLSVLDPQVREFTKNAAGQFLKYKRSDVVTEIFISDAAGFKVAFTSKTSNWCHKGKAKHDVPMTGKSWQGPIEVDESTGVQQVQLAVPVLDNGKPIGSFVAGFSVLKL